VGRSGIDQLTLSEMVKRGCERLVLTGRMVPLVRSNSQCLQFIGKTILQSYQQLRIVRLTGGHLNPARST
jgi:hypothetical protein